jgi:DNA invertase Pin-like site-specific DNA recombinase
MTPVLSVLTRKGEGMRLGYVRVSKVDGSQILDLQQDALLKAGVFPEHTYADLASGKKEMRPELQACLKALRKGDTLVIWRLDRLGRDLRHLVNTIHDLTQAGIHLHVLNGHGANIDTTTASGKLVFGLFAALAEFERDLISERTRAGLLAARARGRVGGRAFKMSPAKILYAQKQMQDPFTKVSVLCKELGISRQTLYRYFDPQGSLRKDAQECLKKLRF